MRKGIIAALAAVLAAASAAAFGEAPAGDAARGKALFMKDMCWTCHGTDGHGTPYGVRLAPNPMPLEGIVNQVRHPRSSMPPYGAKFVSDQDLGDIHAYLASIKPGPKARDLALLKE
jgi:ubiquinol-cytochrome c reductase cytochrome c subunit